MKTRIHPVIATIALLAVGSFAAPQTITVYRSSDCQDVPLAVQGDCLEHRDSKEPFQYLRFELEDDCLALKDSATARACYASTHADSVFAIAKAPVRTVKKTTEEKIEANTHAMMVIAAIQLGITVTAIGVAAIAILLANTD